MNYSEIREDADEYPNTTDWLTMPTDDAAEAVDKLEALMVEPLGSSMNPLKQNELIITNSLVILKQFITDISNVAGAMGRIADQVEVMNGVLEKLAENAGDLD